MPINDAQTIILGEAFFSNYYVAYDRDNDSIHLAEAASLH